MRQRIRLLVLGAFGFLFVAPVLAGSAAVSPDAAAAVLSDAQPTMTTWNEPSTLAMATVACGAMMFVRRRRTH